jgi:MFS transporter, YNFM family, putative membrane transport protein
MPDLVLDQPAARPAGRALGPGPMWGFLIGASAMFATMYSTQAILPELGRDFGVSPARAGLTISALVIAIAAGAWVWGPLSERIGRRRCLVLSSALLVPATLATALAPTFGALVGLRAVQGLLMPGLLAVGIPYVIQVFVPRMGAAAVGWYTASLVAGGLVGRVGVSLVTGALGWRAALGLLALLPLAATIIMARSLPAPPPAAPSATGLAALRRGFGDRRLLAATMVGSSMFFAFVGTFSYVGYRLEHAPFDLSQTGSGLIFLLWLLGAAGPPAGRLAGRVGWRRTGLLAVGLSAAGLALSGPALLPTLVIGLALYTLGMFVGVTSAQLGMGGARGTNPGTASAIYYGVYYVAGALGGYLPGLAFEAAGWGGVTAVAAGALVVALGGLALSLTGSGAEEAAGVPAQRVRERDARVHAAAARPLDDDRAPFLELPEPGHHREHPAAPVAGVQVGRRGRDREGDRAVLRRPVVEPLEHEEHLEPAAEPLLVAHRRPD